jgi:hypothetical protein
MTVTTKLNELDIKLVRAGASIGSNTTTNGTTFDRLGYDDVVFFMQLTARTDGTFTPNVQESDTDGSYTDVADADLYSGGVSSTPEAAAALAAVGASKIAYRGTKRWLRFNVVSTGVTTGATVAVNAILTSPKITVGA